MNFLKTIVRVSLILIVAGGLGFLVFVARGNSIKEKFRIAFFDAAVKHRAEVVEEYYNSLGVKGILDVFEAKDEICHFEAHEVGKVVYERTQDLTESIMTCGNRCTAGCFHGTLIEAFKDTIPKSGSPSDHIELSDLKEKIQEVCSSAAVRSLHREGKCLHGVGHALTVLSHYNMDKALSYCHIINDKPREHYCSEGAFMEFIFLNGPAEAKSGSTHYPCDTFNDFPAACYRSKSQKLRETFRDVERVAEECLKLSNFNRLGCFYGTGFTYSPDVIKNPKLLVNLCQHGNINDKRMCIEGAMEKSESPGAMTASSEACNYLDRELQSFCITAFNNKSYSLEKSFELYFDNSK